MNASSVDRRAVRTRAVGYVSALLVASAGMLAAGEGCDGGREGERCNPSLSHNDCDNGLTCQQPGTCAENYCCPDPPVSSSSPFCRGLPPFCPAPDAGSDAEASADDADASTDGG